MPLLRIYRDKSPKDPLSFKDLSTERESKGDYMIKFSEYFVPSPLCTIKRYLEIYF